MEKNDWWAKGVRFECQQSGNCCISHGEYGFVYLTKDDRKNMAEVLGLRTSDFTRKYCTKTEGIFHLKDDGKACTFLKNNRCTVYKARPMQCRTWPFWPETMGAKAWKKEVAQFCPGVGKGKVWDQEKIAEALKKQIAWEDELVK
jgi:uncharacterized protein